MTEVALKFEDVPERPATHSGGRGVSPYWAGVVEQLRAAHDAGNKQFARVAEFDNRSSATGLATRIRKGQSAAFQPEGYFEAEWRNLGSDDEGPFGVWARYVGPEVDPVDALARESLKDLKALAKARGLKVSGNRHDLAARIVAFDNEDSGDDDGYTGPGPVDYDE